LCDGGAVFRDEYLCGSSRVFGLFAWRRADGSSCICIIATKLGTSPAFDARQLTGTAMPRPAAAPWKTLAHRTAAATARRTPIAARCININATTSSTEPGLEPQVNVDAASVAPASPGTILVPTSSEKLQS
tara:strand:+ start:6001 stop:6393 length:393 start_codon:yes stop_codon:yes gene_type:complete